MLILILLKIIFKIPLCLLALSYNIPASLFKKTENYDIRKSNFSYSYTDLLNEAGVFPITIKSIPKLTILFLSYLISFIIISSIILFALFYKILTIFIPRLKFQINFIKNSIFYLKIVKISTSINFKSLFDIFQFSENTLMTIVCFNLPPILLYKTLITHKSIIEIIETRKIISKDLIKYVFISIWFEL